MISGFSGLGLGLYLEGHGDLVSRLITYNVITQLSQLLTYLLSPHDPPA